MLHFAIFLYTHTFLIHFSAHVFQQQHKQGRRCYAAFWSKSSLIIWREKKKAIQLILFFFLSFFFLSLGCAPFSLDTHYKVNSNCALGHSGKTQGCPQAEALSHSLCDANHSSTVYVYFSLGLITVRWRIGGHRCQFGLTCESYNMGRSMHNCTH